MIIRKSKYERKILLAFKKGRESNILTSEEEALKLFADINGFSAKSVSELIPNKSVFGVPGIGKALSIWKEDDSFMKNMVYCEKYEGKYRKVLVEGKANEDNT